MNYGALKDYVKAAMSKEMPAIDIPGANLSHQHEFQGSAPLRFLLGESDRRSVPARFIYLEDGSEPLVETGTLSWYDARRNKPNRSAEWRLYYSDNEPITHANVGDTLTLAELHDDSLAAIITRSDSSIDSQVRWLFGLGYDHVGRFTISTNEDMPIDASAAQVLEALGIEVELPSSADNLLDGLLEAFPNGLPSTKEFSEYARHTLDLDPAYDEPDVIVYESYRREEMLFRVYEHYEAEREFPLYLHPMDVDGILSYSMSLFQRRKSRAGKSLENSIEALLRARNISFTAQAVTEHNERPDFLFPSQTCYHDQDFPSAGLTLLGAKTTCKDRWRQVLSEGKRIDTKHLVTLEPSISTKQTYEMRHKGLQLVVPWQLHQTYKQEQMEWLWSVGDFFDHVIELEARFLRSSS